MKNVWSKVASKHGTTSKEVKKEVQKAMAIAMLSEDTTAQEHWKRLCPDGKMPSPEEFLKYICMLVLEQAS